MQITAYNSYLSCSKQFGQYQSNLSDYKNNLGATLPELKKDKITFGSRKVFQKDLTEICNTINNLINEAIQANPEFAKIAAEEMQPIGKILRLNMSNYLCEGFEISKYLPDDSFRIKYTPELVKNVNECFFIKRNPDTGNLVAIKEGVTKSFFDMDNFDIRQCREYLKKVRKALEQRKPLLEYYDFKDGQMKPLFSYVSMQ